VGIFDINPSNAASQLFQLSSAVFAEQAKEAVRVASNALAARANKELSKPAVDFKDARIARPQTESAKLKTQKNAFIDEATQLTTTTTQLKKIGAALDAIKAALQSLDSSSTAQDRTDAAATLDAQIQIINGAANNAGGFGKNLIGRPRASDFKTSDLIAATGLGPLVVLGKFEGAEFSITDAGGKLWRVDRGTDQLVQYDAYPDSPTGTAYSLSALSVASYDAGTGAVTLNTPDGPLDGTLQRFGVGVLDSPLYNGLASDADVSRALDDVTAAIANFGLDQSVFDSAQASLKGRLDQLTARIADLDKRVSAATTEQINEKTARDKALKLRVQLQQQALQGTLAAAGAQVDLFFRGAIKTGSILDQFK